MIVALGPLPILKRHVEAVDSRSDRLQLVKEYLVLDVGLTPLVRLAT